MKSTPNSLIRGLVLLAIACFITPISLQAQDIIPLDTTYWDVDANAHVFETWDGEPAIYIQQGLAVLKDSTFVNGTIEFDVFLTERQSFPGIRYRADRDFSESFYFRGHLSGKPDANQVAPVTNGITAWQLYFGPSYSFPYEYAYDRWTHIKFVINGERGQIYMDHSETPTFSYYLTNPVKEGAIALGGSAGAAHYANFRMDKSATEIVDFNPAEREPIEGIVQRWEVSDKFAESELENLGGLKKLIKNRKWGTFVDIEEGTAANISRKVKRYDGQPTNTVFAKVTINSRKAQTVIFDFGYSDRAVAILNGAPIYKGTNRWRSRDYRYLGTVGLFDSVYLDLKRGDNELLFAVSEDFGGWLITGKLNGEGVSVK